MVKRVLIVEDDATIARLLQDNLVYEGFQVQCAGTGAEALGKSATFQPDLLLLDLMLPGSSGFDVCRTLGAQPNHPAIIILTAKGEKADKVRALNLGADDYVTKPFALDELLARVHAVLRRSQPQLDQIFIGPITVDFRVLRAQKGQERLELTHREFELLRSLASRHGGIVTREELLKQVWGYEYVPLTRTVDIAVARLRRKIEPDPHHPRYLRTVHRDGYCLMLE